PCAGVAKIGVVVACVQDDRRLQIERADSLCCVQRSLTRQKVVKNYHVRSFRSPEIHGSNCIGREYDAIAFVFQSAATSLARHTVSACKKDGFHRPIRLLVYCGNLMTWNDTYMVVNLRSNVRLIGGISNSFPPNPSPRRQS